MRTAEKSKWSTYTRDGPLASVAALNGDKLQLRQALGILDKSAVGVAAPTVVVVLEWGEKNEKWVLGKKTNRVTIGSAAWLGPKRPSRP